jgi:hypothetical protein
MQVLALEEVLLAQLELPPDAPENKKDRLLAEQAHNICKLVKGYTVMRITLTMEVNGIGAQNGAVEWSGNGEGNGKGVLVYCNVL